MERTSPSFSAMAAAMVSACTSRPTKVVLLHDRFLSYIALRYVHNRSKRNLRRYETESVVSF